TYTLEAMMQDYKALQTCTSHYLGQNFAKGSGIRFTSKEGVLEHVYTTSWGITTRLIGAMIMCHGDDDGLRLPPRIASAQIVIIPVVPKPELEEAVFAYAEEIAEKLRKESFYGEPLSILIDKRDKRGGEKNWEWIKKGVPLRIEVGPRDMDAKTMLITRRDGPHKEKITCAMDLVGAESVKLLHAIQKNYYDQALAYRDAHIKKNLSNFEEFKAFFAKEEGFVLAKWCGDPATEKMLDDLKVSIRCLPLEQTGTSGYCILTGKPATLDAVFAKSY
ncbi:MAG: His/Gly/Thr/Pro-type tRNA ligase C-terminal domain-containing protein, partial [Chlamydiota bacterium]